jgi:hypothetical protein
MPPQVLDLRRHDHLDGRPMVRLHRRHHYHRESRAVGAPQDAPHVAAAPPAGCPHRSRTRLRARGRPQLQSQLPTLRRAQDQAPCSRVRLCARPTAQQRQHHFLAMARHRHYPLPMPPPWRPLLQPAQALAAPRLAFVECRRWRLSVHPRVELRADRSPKVGGLSRSSHRRRTQPRLPRALALLRTAPQCGAGPESQTEREALARYRTDRSTHPMPPSGPGRWGEYRHSLGFQRSRRCRTASAVRRCRRSCFRPGKWAGSPSHAACDGVVAPAPMVPRTRLQRMGAGGSGRPALRASRRRCSAALPTGS